MKLLRSFYFYILLIPAVLLIMGCASKEINTARLAIKTENNYIKAIEQLNIEIMNNPDNAYAHLFLGSCYGVVGKFKKMNEAFKTSLKLSESNTKSKEEYSEIIEMERDDLWNYSFDEGLSHLKNNHLADAEIAFGNCTLIDSTRPEAFVNLAIIEEENGNLESAILHYARAYQINQEDIDLAFYVSELYSNAEKYEKVIELMDQVLSQKPNYADAIAQKAIAYDYLDEYDKALREYERAVSHFPDDLNLQFNYGRLLLMTDQYEEAIHKFGIVLHADSSDAQAHFLMGASFLYFGEDILNQINAVDSTKIDTLTTDQIVLKKNQADMLFKNAIIHLEQAGQAEKTNPDIWKNLASAANHLGMKSKAEEAMKKSELWDKISNHRSR